MVSVMISEKQKLALSNCFFVSNQDHKTTQKFSLMTLKMKKINKYSHWRGWNRSSLHICVNQSLETDFSHSYICYFPLFQKGRHRFLSSPSVHLNVSKEPQEVLGDRIVSRCQFGKDNWRISGTQWVRSSSGRSKELPSYPSGLQEPGRMGLGQENLPEFTTLQHTI